jgi:hypothetical protein
VGGGKEEGDMAKPQLAAGRDPLVPVAHAFLPFNFSLSFPFSLVGLGWRDGVVVGVGSTGTDANGTASATFCHVRGWGGC